MKNVFEKLALDRIRRTNTSLASDWLKVVLKNCDVTHKHARRLLDVYGIWHLNLFDNKRGRHYALKLHLTCLLVIMTYRYGANNVAMQASYKQNICN